MEAFFGFLIGFAAANIFLAIVQGVLDYRRRI